MAGATGTSAIGGLISGLDTGSLIDQLIAVSRKRVDLVVNEQTLQKDKLTAFQSLNTQLLSFQSAAETLRDDDTFDVFKSSSSTDSTTFTADELVGISTTKEASPGTHTITLTTTSQLAEARQLSSLSFTSSTTALNLTGEFVINGESISVSTTDSLSDIVATINTANSGTNATGVTASLISVSDTDNRMVLTSDNTGEDAFNILDASASTTEDILENLGLASTIKSIKNTTSDGMMSDEFSSSTSAVKSLLGLTTGQSGTVTIGGANVVIDLDSESLSTIATNINTALGVNGTATVVSTTTDGVETFQIDISGTTLFSDNNNILETLGIVERSQSLVAEIHTGSKANAKTTAAGGGVVDGTTKFSEINTGSDANNVSDGDTITISGTKHDGSAAAGSYTIAVAATNDIDGLLTAIDTAFGLTAGSAIINGTGQIEITDSTTGDSQLSVSIVANNGGGGTLDFGTVSVTTEGYKMEMQAAKDAKVTIDGVAVTRSSNTIDDVINGVTLDLNRIEIGSTVDLTISRDVDSIKGKVSAFAAAYNEIIENINQQFTFNEDSEQSGILSGESTLRTIKSIIQSTLSKSISLLPTDANALSLFGITSDKYGKISVDDSIFLSKINSDFYAVKRMFTAEGTSTNNKISYISHSDDTVAGDYSVTISTVATQASKPGTIDLSGPLASSGSLEITDTSTGRVSTTSLTNGDSLDTIVNKINSELGAESTQILAGNVQNTDLGAANITASTFFDQIDTLGPGNDLEDKDVINFTGTNRSGISISDSYTISDAATDSVGDLLSVIENAYDNEVSATIDTSGRIVVTDNTAGDSQISITITSPDSVLDFGTVLASNTSDGGDTGRYAMEITASKSGSNLVLTHDSYGSGYGFSYTETTVSLLGTNNSPYVGLDVIGDIDGNAATGIGQILRGDASSDPENPYDTEGLTVKVTSTGADTGDVNLTMGSGELMYRDVDSITDQFNGLLTIRMDGIQDTIDDMSKSILASEERLAMEALKLNKQFVALELNLSKLQSVSSFMSQQLSQLAKN